jgi:hypothetical protein
VKYLWWILGGAGVAFVLVWVWVILTLPDAANTITVNTLNNVAFDPGVSTDAILEDGVSWPWSWLLLKGAKSIHLTSADVYFPNEVANLP